MSRKDYEKFAALFAGELAMAASHNDGHSVVTVANIVRSVGDIFAHDNSRFDRAKFYAAAGLE